MVAIYGHDLVKRVLLQYIRKTFYGAYLHALAWERLPDAATITDMQNFVGSRFYDGTSSAIGSTNLVTGAVKYGQYTPITRSSWADISLYIGSYAQYFHEPVHYFWQPITKPNGVDAAFSETMAYMATYDYLDQLYLKF